MTGQRPTGYYWECARCRTANPVGTPRCRSCDLANPAMLPLAVSAPPAPSAPARAPQRRRRVAALLLIPAAIIIVVLIAFAGLRGQVTQVDRSIDDALITDSQQEVLDGVAVSGSCAELRMYVVEAEKALAGYPDQDDRFHRAYPERLMETAEAQLDELRCGG